MRTTAILVVSALAIAMAFTPMTAIGATTAALDDTARSISGDDGPGRHECGNNVLPRELEVPVFLTSEADEIGVACTSGDHTRISGLSHGYSDFSYDDWEITSESWLRHPEGSPLLDRGFRCTFSGGISCAGLGGDFPPIGGEFTHECIAYGANPDILELYLREWACHVTL